MTFKATLRNSEKLSVQTSWNLDALHDMVEGSKDRIPAVTEAVLKFINKYHTSHFGFDLNRGGMKLKNVVSNNIETAYHEVPAFFSTLQRSVIHLSDQSKDTFRKASDSIRSINVQDVTNTLTHNARRFLRHSEDRIKVLLDAITTFLSEINLTLPGSQEHLTGLEIFQRARRSASRVIDRAIHRLSDLLRNFREMEFTIPGTDVVVHGERIIENWKSSLRYIRDQLLQAAFYWFEVLQVIISDIFLTIAEKGGDLVTYLKDENQDVAAQIDIFYAEVKQQIGEVRRNTAEYKELAKQKVQDAYNAVNMEDVNNGLKESIGVLQSHLYEGLNEGKDLVRQASQRAQPYVRMSNKKMDVDVPLPFFWKSFSEWPTRSRQ